MSKGLIGLLTVIGIVVIIVIWGMGAYNGIITLDEEVSAKWAQIDNTLQRRSDLVPDLVKVANKYAAHEKEIIDSVTNARAAMLGAGSVEEKVAANNQLSSAMGRLLAVAENYPNLKANEQYIRLMDEMAGTENRIAVARMDYNEAVKSYNVKIKRFPTNLIKGIAGAEEKVFFEIEESAKAKPEYDL